MTDEKGNPPPPAEPAAQPVDMARLAHELRTPLAAISVLAEIIRDERLGAIGNPRYRDYARDIYESAAQANSLLSGMLDPATAVRATFGALEFVDLDLEELVDSTVSALTPLSDKFGLRLVRGERSGKLPRAVLDRRAMRQILDNLIANALKFTPPGRAVVVEARFTPGGPAILEVSDTGDGMPPPVLEAASSGIAMPEPLRRRSGGTGIGLPTIRALAAACGARLEIESALGAGTRVSIVIPGDRLVPV